MLYWVAPVRERGLKSQNHGSQLKVVGVAPVRERGLKSGLRARLLLLNRRSRKGAWIEILLSFNP